MPDAPRVSKIEVHQFEYERDLPPMMGRGRAKHVSAGKAIRKAYALRILTDSGVTGNTSAGVRSTTPRCPDSSTS